MSIGEVRRTLQAFPFKIEDAYLQTWDRILKQSAVQVALAKTALIWVLNSARSMTVEELERAVATSRENHNFEQDWLVPGVTLISLCRGLLTMEEESRLVRLVRKLHSNSLPLTLTCNLSDYTARGTLEGLLSSSFPHPHSLLAAVCMTHLVDCGFQDSTISSGAEFRTTLQKDPLLAYASDAWAFHARAGLDVEETKDQTIQFLLGCHAFPAFTDFSRAWRFDLLTPLHVIALYHLPTDLAKSIAMDNPNITTAVHRQSPLVVASVSGHDDFVAYLISLSETEVNLVDRNGCSPLIKATAVGHKRIVALLLSHPLIVVNLVDDYGSSALMLAAEYGDDDIVALLLSFPGIQINLVGNQGASALLLAAWAGSEGAVALLLAHPEVQVNRCDDHGWTALIRASLAGHKGVVSLLLAHPSIQVNSVDNNGSSALVSVAADDDCDEGIVMLLLASPKIQVNLFDEKGLSALLQAADAGHEGVVALLLERPEIQVNAVAQNGWSALSRASLAGREGVVKLLLAHPAIQVNLVDNSGRSALMLAALEGHIGVVALLLAFPGIQVHLASKYGSSALTLAAGGGHESIVKLLLGYPRFPTIQGSLALWLAAERGHTSVVNLLLTVGEVDVNASDEGDTAIKIAAEGGHEATVRLLLDTPAVDITIKSTADGNTAMSAAQARGYNGIIALLQDFTSRKAAVLDPPGTSSPCLYGSSDEDGSDSDDWQSFHDAEEGPDDFIELNSMK